MNTRLYVVWVGNGEKLKWQSDIPSPMKNNGAVNKTFIIFFLAPRVEMKQFKEKQIFFVKKEVKENEIHTYKLLLKSRFYLKRKKSNNQYVNYAPTIYCPVPIVIATSISVQESHDFPHPQSSWDFHISGYFTKPTSALEWCRVQVWVVSLNICDSLWLNAMR